MKTVAQVAQHFGVNVTKVGWWIAAGELTAVNVAGKVGERPRYRITDAALAAFELKRSTAAPAPAPARRMRFPAGDVPRRYGSKAA